MTSVFEVNIFGPDGEIAALYPEEPDTNSASLNARPYLRKLSNPDETEEWIFVENHDSQQGTGIFDTGWMQAWVVGEPIPSPPQQIASKSITFAAVRNEIDASPQAKTRIAAEYLIALFLIENQVDLTADITADAIYPVNNPIADADSNGAFSISTAQWESFIAAEGDRLKWTGLALKELILPQLRCAAWHSRENWKELGVRLGGSAVDPFIARMLDLFMAHLIGHKAAAEVIKLERDDTGLTKNIKTVIRDANSWSDNAPELAAMFENRPSYLGPLKATGGTTGGMRRVQDFLDTCREVLAPALVYARELVKFHLPGFVVESSEIMAAALAKAQEELADWQQDGGWVEQTDPGLTRAKGYFEATDFPNASVAIGADGELTHWCGAFVASCVREAGGKEPAGAAAAANWRKWGDASLPATDGSAVPPGAVVMTAGNKGTSGISHVNFFVEWAGDGVHYRGLGGNQSDKVTIGNYRIENIADIRVMASKTSTSDEDAVIMAKTLHGEIGTTAENDDQIKNVADVILNRFISGYRSGGSIAGTCLEHKQFSCWNPGTSARHRLETLPDTDETYQRMLELAQHYIAQRTANPDAPPPLEGARHYHNHHVSPDWMIVANQVHDDGKHIFYKNIA